jgi:Arc/MetJ-type ribon-helix-helix transcriptional regulator
MATMTHTVTLSPEQSQRVDAMIAEGRFASPEDAIGYSLELAAHESTGLSQYSAETMAHLDEGAAQVQRGEVVSQEEVEEFFADWRSELGR